MSIEAMKLALEALEVSTDWDVNATGKQAKSMKAITALRTAIEQTERNEFNPDWDRVEALQESLCEYMAEIQRLHGLLEQAKKQEPVGFMCQGCFYELDDVDEYCDREHVYLYTHPSPSQRQWVGLTGEEIEMIVENKRAAHWEFVRQVEAKLKEKNT